MAKRYKRPDKNDFRYKLILGLFILSLLLGIAGVIYFGMRYNSYKFLFWAFLVWTIFFAVTLYSWVDEDRYARYEHLMQPIIFGALFLLLVGLFIGGLFINIPKIASGENVVTNLLALIIGEASIGAFALITYKYFLKEYIDKLFH